MRELSRILAKAGISISTEENIWTEVESLSTTPEMTDEPKSQELQNDFLCKTVEKADILWITFEGQKPEIKEFFTCKLTDLAYAQTTAQLEEEDLYDI